MDTITLTIDSVKVEAKAGTSVLEAAQNAGIYIPRICYHPDLPPAPETKVNDRIYRGGKLIENTSSGQGNFEGCKLCLVQIEGMNGLSTACDTQVANNMVV